jgi:hypothetical protein
MNHRALADPPISLWEATVAAHAPDTHARAPSSKPRSINNSDSVQVRVSPTDYVCTIRVRAVDLADANRQALGRWCHAIEVYDLPAWPATAFVLRPCQPPTPVPRTRP